MFLAPRRRLKKGFDELISSCCPVDIVKLSDKENTSFILYSGDILMATNGLKKFTLLMEFKICFSILIPLE